MSDAEQMPGSNDELSVLRAHAEDLSRQLAEAREAATAGLIHSELKAEATRAGMIDMDGLKLLPPGSVSIGDDGAVHGAMGAITALRHAKPWLFGVLNSSSATAVPAAAPASRKLATEMSLHEWRIARAELLRRR